MYAARPEYHYDIGPLTLFSDNTVPKIGSSNHTHCRAEHELSVVVTFPGRASERIIRDTKV